MGHHYLPQYYLKGFTEGNTIWAHDRLNRRSFASQPKGVANENRMYSEELEKYLQSAVENPADSAIEKIRCRQPLELVDRKILAQYIVTLWKRVPEGRSRVAAAMPAVAAAVREELHQELDAIAQENPDLAHLKDQRKALVDNALDRHQKNIPSEIWHGSLGRDSSSKVIESVLSMDWRFLCSDRDQFLTCDNPVFFFTHEGISAPTSELAIPFSSSVALWAKRNHAPGPIYFNALPGAVREVNRRMASNMTRFAYSKFSDTWILPFVCKSRYELNRLR